MNLFNSSHSNEKNNFHKRRSSLTTICPPTDKREYSSKKKPVKNQDGFLIWVKQKILKMSFIQLVGWTYLLICFTLSTVHLINSFSSLEATNTIFKRNHKTASHSYWDKVLFQDTNEYSNLDEMLPESRLSKMFSKSIVSNEFVRPYWFTASIKPNKDSLTLSTVVEYKYFNDLISLVELYKGPISATLIVTSDNDIHHEESIQIINEIRTKYETTLNLKRHVDLHLLFQSNQHVTSYQKARNMARLFSRSDYIALIPIQTLWITSIQSSFKNYIHLLKAGDLLVLPTFSFPQYDGIQIDSWPTDKQSIIEWVEAGELGLLDENYELNNGPTSFHTWKDSKDPYLVPNYDYKYGPIFISTKSNHPWCDERFEDYLPSCIYNNYLAGANLWVLPNDYAVNSGQFSIDYTMTPQQRKTQNKIASKYRVEQCVFYARQFDQFSLFDTERAEHVKQECSKALLSLQKENMISKVIQDA